MKDRQWEIVMAQVLIVICAAAFIGPVSKKIVLRGLKTHIQTRKLRLWHFNVSLPTFNRHILYALHLQADNYARRCVNEVTVCIKIPQNKCKAYSATVCCFVLTQRYTMCPGRYWETCTPFPQASKPTSNYTPEASRPVALSSNKYLPAGEVESIN